MASDQEPTADGLPTYGGLRQWQAERSGAGRGAYTAAQRAFALACAFGPGPNVIGVDATTRRLGVGRDTLYRWQREAGAARSLVREGTPEMARASARVMALAKAKQALAALSLEDREWVLSALGTLFPSAQDHASHAHEPPGTVRTPAHLDAARELAAWLSTPWWAEPVDDEPGSATRLDLWRDGGGGGKPPCDVQCVRADGACPQAIACLHLKRQVEE